MIAHRKERRFLINEIKTSASHPLRRIESLALFRDICTDCSPSNLILDLVDVAVREDHFQIVQYMLHVYLNNDLERYSIFQPYFKEWIYLAILHERKRTLFALLMGMECFALSAHIYGFPLINYHNYAFLVACKTGRSEMIKYINWQFRQHLDPDWKQDVALQITNDTLICPQLDNLLDKRDVLNVKAVLKRHLPSRKQQSVKRRRMYI